MSFAATGALTADERTRVRGLAAGVYVADLRKLFDHIYDNLETEDSDHADGPSEDTNPYAVGLAMAETITGIQLIVEDITIVQGSGYFAGPTQNYAS